MPAAQRLGEEGEGFKIAMATLDGGRIGIAAQAVGIAQGAFEEALAYAQQREQFGQTLAEFQAIQFYLADMATELDAAPPAHLEGGLGQGRTGKRYTLEAAQAKLFASEMAQRVTNKALQIHGGYGYTKEYNVERYFRDARITEIYEGTSEIQKMVIADWVLNEPDGAAPMAIAASPPTARAHAPASTSRSPRSRSCCASRCAASPRSASAPAPRERDREHRFPRRDLSREMGELGLLGMLVPRSYGGAGARRR